MRSRPRLGGAAMTRCRAPRHLLRFGGPRGAPSALFSLRTALRRVFSSAVAGLTYPRPCAGARRRWRRPETLGVRQVKLARTWSN